MLSSENDVTKNTDKRIRAFMYVFIYVVSNIYIMRHEFIDLFIIELLLKKYLILYSLLLNWLQD